MPSNPPLQAVLACIGMGSNVGNRAGHMAAARAALEGLPDSLLLAVSKVIETDAVGPVLQLPFLNAAALLHTALAPRDLLDRLLLIERERGRDRGSEQRWGPRTLDLDLLLYGDRVIDEPGLTVPHPRMHERAFVLTPLSQIAPDLIVPTLGKTVGQLAAALKAALT